MAWNSTGDELGRAAHRIRGESQRLVALARAAVARSKDTQGLRPEDRFARRRHLLQVKDREIAQIEKAIRFYVDAADRWRRSSETVIADKLDARAVVERERLALAIAERDTWPPVVETKNSRPR
jgi:hypothetical protein